MGHDLPGWAAWQAFPEVLLPASMDRRVTPQATVFPRSSRHVHGRGQSSRPGIPGGVHGSPPPCDGQPRLRAEGGSRSWGSHAGAAGSTTGYSPAVHNPRLGGNYKADEMALILRIHAQTACLEHDSAESLYAALTLVLSQAGPAAARSVSPRRGSSTSARPGTGPAARAAARTAAAARRTSR